MTSSRSVERHVYDAVGVLRIPTVLAVTALATGAAAAIGECPPGCRAVG